MKGYLVFFAVSLAIAGIICNITFYSTVGGGGWFSFFYGFIGFLFDGSKFGLVFVFVNFLAKNMTFESILTSITFIVLTLISLGAAFGFLSIANDKYESKGLLKSDTYETRKAAVESAQAQAENLSKFADVTAANAAKSQNSLLNNELKDILNAIATNSKGASAGSIRSRVGDCSGNGYYIRKYCGQINTLKNQIEQQNATIINGHAQYLAALAHRDKALSELSNLSSATSTNVMNPMFVNAGTMFNLEATKVKVGFLGITAVVMELLSSILFFLKARLYDTGINIVKTCLETEQNTTHAINSTSLQTSEIEEKKNSLKTSLKTNPKRSLVIVHTTSNRLFKEATNAIKSGSLRPSLAALRKWKTTKGVKLTDATIKLWQESLNEKGLIELFKLPNGLQTYRLAK